MTVRNLNVAIALVVSMVVASQAHAATDAEWEARVQRLENRISELETDKNGNWLNERRAEEIKALVQDVLSDADTRASLMADGAVAGHDGKHFFLASADGSFLLEFAGQIQFRWISNFENDDTGVADGDDHGFQIRRTKLNFSGHVEAAGKWDYEVVLAVDRTNGSVEAEDVVIARKLADGVKLKFGKFKLPFLREELTSSKRQLAVDRSSVTEFFTLDRSEQVALELTPMDNVKAVFSFNDGSDEEFSTIGADEVELSFTGRIDVALAGNLSQIKDFAAWSGEPFGAFIGAAFHYQTGDAKNDGLGSNEGETDYFSWTIDGSIETNGFNIFAAVMGNSHDADTGSGNFDGDQLGVLIQGGYMVIPDKLEPFVRFEYIDSDQAALADDDAMILTLGANWYMKKHNAKLTIDAVIILDGSDFGAFANDFTNSQDGDGLGFSSGDTVTDDTVLVRVQFQLLF